MKSIESKIYEEVKSRCLSPNNAYGIGAWDHHIKLVYELAKNNAKSYGANEEVVALAALLHDIASVTNKDFTEEHHIIGATFQNKKIYIATKILLNTEGRIEMINTYPIHLEGQVF